MKKFTKLFAFVALVAFTFVCLVACGQGGGTGTHTHKDVNKDCVCDTCAETMPTHKPGDNCICPVCNFDFHTDPTYYNEHVDSSLVCDACGKSFAQTNTDYKYIDSATCEHQDVDGNCVCDLCFTGLGHNFVSGVCSVCHLTKRVSGNYTYTSSFQTSPSTWNPHTMETSDDGDAMEMQVSGLYGFYFNGDKTGYEVWPEMASAYPEDVTEEVKAMEYNFGIPEDATEHYAYKIRLNKNAKWDTGEAIKAVDWVESFELLMNPQLLNYRAADQMSGNVVVAGCKNYYYQGTTAYIDNGDLGYELADLEKNGEGQYCTPDGELVYLGVDFALAWLGGYTLADYVGAYASAYFDVTYWDEIEAAADENGLIPLTDAWYAKYSLVTTGNPAWGEGEADVPNYFVIAQPYEANYSFSKVGMFVDPEDEYAFYMVLEKPAFGFYYIYGMSTWLVKVDAYRAGMTTNPDTGVTSTDYNTSLATTHSYGPYVMSVFQLDKEIDYVRNVNWFGYNDSRFDCMYHTSAITQEKVTESSTRKEMFLKGELISYGLQAADYAQYGQSDYYYNSPGSTLFFMILSANESALSKLEESLTGVNKTIICNANFRHAMSLAFNKQEFAQAISPARTPAYSVVGAYDIWNPVSGEKYRNTEIAKKAIVEFYGYVLEDDGYYHIEGSDFAYTLDEANEAINGYSPAVAKVLFDKAYDEWVAEGKIGPNDIVEIEYATSTSSDFQTKLINELNRQLARTLEGTKLAGRVVFKDSAPYGDSWSDALKNSSAQTCLAGWQGGMLDPFSSMLYYLEPNHNPYAKSWWKTEAINLELTLPVGEDGEDVTIKTTLANWSLMLTGSPKTIDGVEYNFGYAQVADEVRLTILAEFEKAILGTDYYIPFMQDASGFLLSQKVSYVLGRNDYNAVLGRGGITYMTYNYTDEAWAAYVASQGGTLVY